MREEKVLDVGILLYEGADILDMAGPAEVFSAGASFRTRTIGLGSEPVKAGGIFKLLPDVGIDNCPHLDVLVVPGGEVEEVVEDEELLRWLKAMSIKTNILMSVCTGAFLLAAAGLLDDRPYTTSQQHLEKLRSQVPNGQPKQHVRFVDSGNIITTAGISACIDGALQVVKRLQGV
ncbi:MAG: DJ-1/PfpI family protein, partial [Bacteroidetes bacterium]|nr:DJ-1/PfpI family protein [Bacteroidota bacterium]